LKVTDVPSVVVGDTKPVTKANGFLVI
jgi:hypothetical protein